LNPGSDIKKVEKKFEQVYAVHAKQQLAEKVQLYGFDPQITYHLQPIEDIHFNYLAGFFGRRRKWCG
jgi:hypothetical protein